MTTKFAIHCVLPHYDYVANSEGPSAAKALQSYLDTQRYSLLTGGETVFVVPQECNVNQRGSAAFGKFKIVHEPPVPVTPKLTIESID